MSNDHNNEPFITIDFEDNLLIAFVSETFHGVKSGSTTIFSLKGDSESGGAIFNLNSKMNGSFNGTINLLGIESESAFTVTPSLLSYTTSGSLIGALEASLNMTATDFTDIKDATFTIDGTITQDITDDIINEVEDAIGSELALLIGTALLHHMTLSFGLKQWHRECFCFPNFEVGGDSQVA